MVFAVERCRAKSDRVRYQRTTIADSDFTIATAYGSLAYTGTIAIRPQDDSCGGCEGVLILEFINGALTGRYWANGGTLQLLTDIELQQRNYVVNYFPNSGVYYAAAQFTGNCGFCGCDDCERIWNIDSDTVTWDSLSETETKPPSFEEAIPLAFAAQNNKGSSIVCDDTIEFLDFNRDIDLGS